MKVTLKPKLIGERLLRFLNQHIAYKTEESKDFFIKIIVHYMLPNMLYGIIVSTD